MNEKNSFNDTSEQLIEKTNQLDIITEQFKYNLKLFDESANLNEKKQHLDELQRLLTEYNELQQNAKSNFYITPNSKRKSLKKKLTLSVQEKRDFNNLYLEKENIYKTLSEQQKKNEFHFEFSFDLGESNLNILDYSRTKMVLDDANNTYQETDAFIQNIENLIKQKPIINPNDEAYKSYLNFITQKEELSKKNKIRKIKKILLILFIFCIIIGLFIFIFVEEEDKFGL